MSCSPNSLRGLYRGLCSGQSGNLRAYERMLVPRTRPTTAHPEAGISDTRNLNDCQQYGPRFLIYLWSRYVHLTSA